MCKACPDTVQQCVAPTQIGPDKTGTACRAFHGRRCIRLGNQDDWRSSAEICGNLPFGIPCVRGGRGQQSRSIIVHLEVFTNWATQCVAPTKTGSRQDRYTVPGRSMGTVSFVSVTGTISDHLWKSTVRHSLCPGGLGQQSRSIIVHLEVFTNWATPASPLQGQAPDKDRDSVPGRSMGAVSFVTPRMRKLQSKKR